MRVKSIYDNARTRKVKKEKLDVEDIDYISISNGQTNHLVKHIARANIVGHNNEETSDSFMIQYSGDIVEGMKLCKNCGTYTKQGKPCRCRATHLSVEEVVKVLKSELETINHHKVSINGKPIKK